jgi:hypothetical protein
VARPRPAPEPDRYSPCARCRQAYKPVAHWPDGTVCQYCYLAAKRTRGTCPACDHDGVLPGRDSDGRPTCRPCSGVTLNVDCQECGREDELHSGSRCWACTLRRHVEALLTGPDGSVPPSLQPLVNAIASMTRPNSGVTWLRAAPVRALLQGLADGSIPLTHQALDQLPVSRTVEYIRGLLVQQSVLPGRDRRVADFERWLQALLAKQTDDEQRRLLERYGRWHHLRRLRALSAKAPVSESAFQRAKQCLTVSAQFIGWLAAAGIPLAELGQTHIDQWYADGTGTAVHVETFLYWAIDQRLLPATWSYPAARIKPHRLSTSGSGSTRYAASCSRTRSRCRSESSPGSSCCSLSPSTGSPDSPSTTSKSLTRRCGSGWPVSGSRSPSRSPRC